MKFLYHAAFWSALFHCFFSMASIKEVSAKNIRTNELYMVSAPAWLKQKQVEKVADRVQTFLEHQIRRVQVRWVASAVEFESIHKLGPSVRAVTYKEKGVILLGPQVNAENFEAIFGHELAHVVIGQKFQNGIPSWLEEGLANYAVGRRNVDYAFLVKSKGADIQTLGHPFVDRATGSEEGSHLDQARFHYQASMALMLLLESKCGDLKNLLQMSVKKGLENYLATTCEIPDLNAAYRIWIQRQASTK